MTLLEEILETGTESEKELARLCQLHPTNPRKILDHHLTKNIAAALGCGLAGAGLFVLVCEAAEPLAPLAFYVVGGSAAAGVSYFLPEIKKNIQARAIYSYNPYAKPQEKKSTSILDTPLVTKLFQNVMLDRLAELGINPPSSTYVEPRREKYLFYRYGNTFTANPTVVEKFFGDRLHPLDVERNSYNLPPDSWGFIGRVRLQNRKDHTYTSKEMAFNNYGPTYVDVEYRTTTFEWVRGDQQFNFSYTNKEIWYPRHLKKLPLGAKYSLLVKFESHEAKEIKLLPVCEV